MANFSAEIGGLGDIQASASKCDWQMRDARHTQNPAVLVTAKRGLVLDFRAEIARWWFRHKLDRLTVGAHDFSAEIGGREHIAHCTLPTVLTDLSHKLWYGRRSVSRIRQSLGPNAGGDFSAEIVRLELHSECITPDPARFPHSLVSATWRFLAYFFQCQLHSGYSIR